MTTNPSIEIMSERPPSPMLPSMLPAKYAAKKAREPVAKVAAKKAREPVAKVAAKKTRKPVAKAAAKKTRKPAAKAAAKKAREPFAKAAAKGQPAAKKARQAPAADGQLHMPVGLVASILKRFHAPFRVCNGMTSPVDASLLVHSSQKRRQEFYILVAHKLKEEKTDH